MILETCVFPGQNGAPGRIRTRDPLLRRSFRATGQPAAFLIRASLLVVWQQLGVSGFQPVLARPWHVVWMQTTGAILIADRQFSLVRGPVCPADRFGLKPVSWGSEQGLA